MKIQLIKITGKKLSIQFYDKIKHSCIILMENLFIKNI